MNSVIREIEISKITGNLKGDALLINNFFNNLSQDIKFYKKNTRENELLIITEINRIIGQYNIEKNKIHIYYDYFFKLFGPLNYSYNDAIPIIEYFIENYYQNNYE